MSSYGPPMYWGRGAQYPGYPPYPSDRPPYGGEYGYEYANSTRPRGPSYSTYEHRPAVNRPHLYDDPNGPDIIHIRHMNQRVELKFEPYSISDGDLRIKDIRIYAAEMLGVRDPSRLRLLYKGKQLKEDRKSAKEYGLKQNSELMVVVSESPPSRPNSDSENEDGSNVSRVRNRPQPPQPPLSTEPRDSRYQPGHLAPNVSEQESPVSRRNSMRRTRGDRAPSPYPRPESRPPQSPAHSPAQSPPPKSSPPHSPPVQTPASSDPTTPVNDIARAKIESMKSLFHTQWVPKCVHFIHNPPADPKARETEHKRLSESIMSQIMLKVDDITVGEDVGARNMRREFAREINEMFADLDAAK